jgi:hypothetical protein
MQVIHLARKPLIGTVAKNALKFGTGGVNIDRSRVHSGGEHIRTAGAVTRKTSLTGDERTGKALGMFAPGSTYVPTNHEGGRWPTNIILHHLHACVCQGTKKVPVAKEGAGLLWSHIRDGVTERAKAQPSRIGDADGFETVAQWVCAPGCPAAALDGLGGCHAAGNKRATHSTTGSGPVFGGGGWQPRLKNPDYYADADMGGVSRYFKQVQERLMPGMPQDLIDYLCNMIGTPETPGTFWDPVAEDVDTALGLSLDNSVPGILFGGEPTPEQSKELMRVLMPGAHLMIVAPEDEPTGHTGACLIEDEGFEIRDAILWAQEGSKLHYVPKAGRAEREAGCQDLKGKAGHEAVERKEGSAGLDSPRAGAGRTAGHVKNTHPCLHPDALVMTELGYRPISELQEGVQVYGEDGLFHPIEVVSHHPYTSANLYEIAVRGTNYTTLASDNHPFLIWRPIRKGKSIVGGEVSWVEAQDIRTGDYTMTPRLTDTGVTSPFEDEYWWVFGLWLAEGVLQRAGHGSNVYPSFTLHQDETEYIERLRRFFGARGVNLGVYPKPGAKAVQVVGFDPEVGKQFAEWSPCGAANKRLPYVIWHRQRSCWSAVFEGYMAGDGGKVRTYRQAKTVSPDLASQMRLLGEALGTKANLFRYDALPGSLGDREFKTTLPTYQTRFYDRDMNQTTRKPARPVAVTHQGVTYRLAHVQWVTPAPYTGDVWNLTVHDCPTFQTAVGMSHNTVKPIALMERLLADVPKDAGPVLDPFMGSGTTGIAAARTGHDFIGIERGEDYLEIADTRIRHWNEVDLKGVISGSGAPMATISSDHEPPPDEAIPLSGTFGALFGGGDD